MSTLQRTALVTGGNRGLGAAIARSLHDAGHRDCHAYAEQFHD